MASATNRAGMSFWLLWVAASAIAFALGAAAHQYAGTIRADRIPVVLAFTVSVGVYPVAATLPGCLHWLILRRKFRHAGWWVLASGAGSLLGYIPMIWGLGVADTQGGTIFARNAVLASMAGAGTIVGVTQWMVLRRWVRHAGWWVVVSSISWVVAETMYLTITRASEVYPLAGAAASGALSGAITGTVLMVMIREDRRFRPTIQTLMVLVVMMALVLGGAAYLARLEPVRAERIFARGLLAAVLGCGVWYATVKVLRSFRSKAAP